MRNKHLIVTVLLIGMVDFIGYRLFETSNRQYWFKPVYFSFIVINFLLGFNFWKKRTYNWLKIFWSAFYCSIMMYFIVSWALEYLGIYKCNFIYKTFIHFGLSPLTFGFLYLIEFTVKNSDDIPYK